MLSWYLVGRRQWFIRDDWAFLLTRPQMKHGLGVWEWLNQPQDGHWMAPPLLIFRGLQNAFALDSYWPFLVVLLATHLGTVLLVRQICRRLQVSEWVTAMMCAVLLVLGSGWENILFAVQITYNFSLLAFLAQVLLTDHDGPVDHRDWLGAAIAVIGVMSSGFGPFFIFGIALLMILRRRWRAAIVAVVPQALVYGWWLLSFGSDRAADQRGRHLGPVPTFVRRGVLAAFGGLGGAMFMAGAAALVAAGVTIWRHVDWQRRTYLLTAWAVVLAMYTGIGVERASIDPEMAISSRYVYMAAMVIAPVLALGIDQIRRFAPWGTWVAVVLLGASALSNASELRNEGNAWANIARQEQYVLEVAASSGLADRADPQRSVLEFSMDVRASDLRSLVEQHAIRLRALDDTEIARAAAALGVANVRP